jgi:ribosomal protein S4
VLVSTTRKWTESRRYIRPRRRRAGYGRAGGGRTTNSGRPQVRRYRDSFYRKQQLRAVHGKRRETALRTLVARFRGSSTTASGGHSGSSSHGGASSGSAARALSASLEGRLDRILFRRRVRPTIYAAHQFVYHGGVAINGSTVPTPQAVLRVGDTRALLPIFAGPAYAGKTSSQTAAVVSVPSTVRRARLAA